MIFVYNFLQAFLLIITFPFVLLIVLIKKKYRTRILDRLGFGLEKQITCLKPGAKKTIWIHCLSVGEVTSALPLVKGIRDKMDVTIIFSASTMTGMNIAQGKIKPYVDLVLSAPLDLWPVVNRFVRHIQPDLFILVETDFWPNWLYCMQQNDTLLMLVNGRISKKSFSKYRRFLFFFPHLFNSFSLLSMQTEHDASQMALLGVPAERIKTLGNLKYNCLLTIKEVIPGLHRNDFNIPENSHVWVCGSTHPGEEEMIISAFANLSKKNKNNFLLLAPRDPGRSGEIQKLFTQLGLPSMLRTCPEDSNASIMILDTIGELAECYRFARVAFIGGSLVDFGGHNPLEAASVGTPVLFGPHMDDFLEIARDLTECGGAAQVGSAAELEKYVSLIFEDDTVHQKMSVAASKLVANNSGVIEHHIQEISILLSQESEVN